MKMTLQTTLPPLTQCQQYLCCYCPDFDETLIIGSWEYLEQIPTVTVTFVQATFVQATFVHIRNISAVTYPILMKIYRLVPENIQNRFKQGHLFRQRLSWRHLFISGQGKVREMSGQVQGKVKARSK